MPCYPAGHFFQHRLVLGQLCFEQGPHRVFIHGATPDERPARIRMHDRDSIPPQIVVRHPVSGPRESPRETRLGTSFLLDAPVSCR